MDLKDDLVSALKEYYQSYVVESANGAFQIFQSFTYGEMLISFLLLISVLLYVFKWLWEVLR